MSNSQVSLVYYTYIDNNGKVQASKFQTRITSSSDTKEMNHLEYLEEMVGEVFPDHHDILIMLVENKECTLF